VPPAPSPTRPDQAIDVEEAVRYNRDSSRKLGWSFDQIRRFFGFGQMPDERRLALTVAQWQQSQGLKVDGKIGPNTWKRMQAVMGTGRSPEPVKPSRTGDTRRKTGKKPTGIISVPLEHMVPGIDVSHYVGRIDWARVAGEGIRFAYIKATEGRTWKDDFFQKNWQEAKANRVIRGAYHLLKRGSSSSVESQAQNFLETVTLTPGDMPPALDVETKELKKIIAEEGVEHAWKFIYQWVELIRQETGYTSVLYMSPRRAASLKLNFGKLPILDLWTPSYGANRPLRFATDKPNIKNLPTLPLDVNNRLIWSKWVFWQYSSAGRVAGIASGHVDLNLFNGNDSDFNRWLEKVQP
jgi:lysozyme